MIELTATELDLVMRCPGSYFMTKNIQERDSTVRNEGNAAHHVAELIFNGAEPESLIGTPAKNGLIITADMVRHVSEYVSALDCGHMEHDTSWSIDGRFRINGRADHVHYNRDTTGITIDDFKYGWSLVEPENNWTLISHAIGFRNQSYKGEMGETITLRIHQPRPYHHDGTLREWTITCAQLDEKYKHIVDTLSNLTQETSQLVTGVGHCKNCAALATCPAAHSSAMNAIDSTSRTFDDNIDNVNLSQELDTLRTASKVLDNRLSALEELALHRIKGGQVIRNYAVDAGKGQSKWKEGLTPEFLSVATGVNLVETSAVTPAEAIRRGVSDTVIKSLTERPSKGVKLIRVDADKHAKKLFNKGKS